MWYDGYKTLTHNCLFNFVIGNRGAGKSYWSKRWAIKDFIKSIENKEQPRKWAYVRRYETELEEVNTYFDDIKREFEGHTFEVKGYDFYVDGLHSGQAFALSTSSILKSNAYPEYDKIIYDEFIIEQGVHHYLKNEVRKFLDLYETINRLRLDPRDEVKVFFLSNAITMTNPYFLYFDLKLPYNKNVIKKGELLLQLVADSEFIEKKKKTRFGSIINGTEYEKYSVENNFLLDNDTFVMKKTSKAKFFFSFKFKGNKYGVWVDYNEGKYFVSNDIDPSCRIVYSITLDDHQENTLLLKSLSQSALFKKFIDGYKLGVVYFENIKIKNIVYEVIRMCLK